MALTFFLVAGVFALAYLLRFAAAAPGWPKSVVKTLSVLALAVAAFGAGAPALIWSGLALGALGDFCLSRPSQQAFLAGMAAFAGGHLAYVGAIVGFGGGWPGWALALPLGLLLVSAEVWLAPYTHDLRWPVRGYVLVIGAMGLVAMGLPAPFAQVQIGALAFILSDLLLAIETFRLPDGHPMARRLKHLLWVFYWGGQAMIAAGTMG
ncbi:lysoplasmalogenase [Thioclava sp. A2]|uniref:lysoplasmalogenase n=1 Tax=Thioclava sp. FCG-A2 TaxID=3080562 RepID=UPI002954B498|nr:lysoplasmalogenase [Thioclava sp. A2]MDV7270124.1 lysoplasmalogenase [Thioclava sp. A2]